MCKPTCSCKCCERLCALPDCDKPHYAHGWCARHWKVWRAHGDAAWTRPTLAERFWAKVDKSGDCWVWTGYRSPLGYGRITVNKHPRQAHGIAWELSVGPIPEGLELDHLCRNPPCVNPAHLEPVTHRTNMRRGAKGRQTHCKWGHPFDERNTYWKRSGTRGCRACHRIEENRRRAA